MSKTSPSYRPASLPPGTQLEGYCIVRKLSVGGFGVVYLAIDRNNIPVAIKEYLPASIVRRAEGELAPTVSSDRIGQYHLGLKSFFDEGRVLAQISHPAVVGVQNFFRANETIYMVMNYLQGATLQDFVVTARDLKREKLFRESTIRSLFDEILHGLRIVHQHKLLHLDIKPANLFITNGNKAVLIDFGAAQRIMSKSLLTLRPMYTPSFAAPEMYEKNSALGPWTDIYAIGACMFTCMHGYPPIDASARAKKDKLGLVLGRLRGRYSNNLVELVEWCMALDMGARPQSVYLLQKALNDTEELSYCQEGVGTKIRANLERWFR